MVIELVKLGEVRVLSVSPKEHLGSVVQPSARGSKLSLEMRDSTEKADDLAACMLMWFPCFLELNACK